MNVQWKVLNWNVRGINDKDKWLALSNKIEESRCDQLFLQETKREHFDHQYVKSFCPERLNKFDYQPSVGASGGLLVVWNDSTFFGETLFQNKFSISIRFTYRKSSISWILTNIYGPCQADDR